MVFRLGFAGARRLPPALADGSALGSRLRGIVSLVRETLLDAGRSEPFYADAPPTLRLVTGLAEGADQIAAGALLAASDDDGPMADGERRCRLELAGVLPFRRDAFRATLAAPADARFDELAGRCAFVIEVHGASERPTPDTLQSKARRSKAHRTQAQLLLHNIDVLVAVADLSKAGEAGGTLETVRTALSMGLPTVLLDISDISDSAAPGDAPDLSRAWLLSGRDDPGTAVLRPPLTPERLAREIQATVAAVIAFPAEPAAHAGAHGKGAHPARPPYGHEIVAEFTGSAEIAPWSPLDFGRLLVRGLRRLMWPVFRHAFNERGATSERRGGGPPAMLLERQVEKARRLAADASLQYRSAFLLNYSGAVVAVLLAAAALLLLGHVAGNEDVVRTLFAIAVVKFVILAVLAANTLEASSFAWGRRAAHWRYLRERLRALEFLPKVGCFRAVGTRSIQLTARVTRESPIDWLFAAIVRSHSPADCMERSADAPTTGVGPAWLVVDPAKAIESVRTKWAEKQATYHRGASLKQRRLAHGSEFTAECINWTVVALVCIDAILLGSELFHPAPTSPSIWIGLLVLLTAALPAAVASIHGFRSQSECEQLAKRYGMMEGLLGATSPNGPTGHVALLAGIERDMQGPAAGDLAWEGDVLAATVALAQDFVDETADWTVMSAKAVPGI